jgi:hypothetical protein
MDRHPRVVEEPGMPVFRAYAQTRCVPAAAGTVVSKP